MLITGKYTLLFSPLFGVNTDPMDVAFVICTPYVLPLPHRTLFAE